MKSYCNFCLQDVEEPHIYKCPVCGGYLHIVSDIGTCATCGRHMIYKQEVKEPATTRVIVADTISVEAEEEIVGDQEKSIPDGCEDPGFRENRSLPLKLFHLKQSSARNGAGRKNEKIPVGGSPYWYKRNTGICSKTGFLLEKLG
jgi:hypothetical protein